jgi:uncharacterized protein
MPQVSYPGVYIQEVPSGVRTVTSVSTSIAAFIDFFKQGPVNEAVQIFGMTDFERIYGGLDDRSEGSYAISQFFLNGGSEAHVVRVAKDDPAALPGIRLRKASVKLKADTSGGGAVVLEVSAINEGIWGNTLRVDVDHNTTDPTKLFNLYVTRYDGTGGKARALIVEKYLNLAVDPVTHSRYVEAVVNDESSLIRVKHTAAGTADATKLPAMTGTVSGDLVGLTQANFNAMSGKKLKIKMPSTATAKDVTLDTWSVVAGSEGVKSLRDLRGYLETAIRKADTTSALFTGASVDVVNNKLRVLMGRGGDTYTTTDAIEITDFSVGDTTATLVKLTDATDTGANVQEYALGLAAGADIAALKKGDVGGDGDKPGADEIVGSLAVDPHTGMYALDYVDLFNILCIPRAADLSATEMTTVVSKALKYCEDRRAFMIIDIPKTIDQTQEMKDWLDANSAFRHKNAAVYFPRPAIPDPKNEYRLRYVGASGTMAGLYARTDGSRGVWKTPAGIEATLSGVTDLATKLSDAQNGTLNPLGINCLRSFPVYGNIAWGGRTLDGADALASDWKYLAVRRLTLMIEESLFRGTKWVVFEGNDEKLWAKIRQNLGAYMMSLFRQGAFQGTDPKAAFYVKCDKETTTQNDINQGIVNIEVGFAPLKPAEFVVIKIQQIAGQE